jgi:hypothetical protein
MTLLDFLREHRVPYREHGDHHHVSDGWAGIDCPECSPDSGRFRLGINLSHLYATCWTCGFQPLAPTLAGLTGLHPTKVKELLGGLVHTRDDGPKRGRLRLPKGVGPLLEIHKRYLRQRGFDPDVLAKVWGVQGIGLHPTLAWRLLIPITCRGEVVSWTTRGLTEDGKRYVNARPEEEAVPAKSLLFGGDLARHAVIVVEGPFDAMRIGPGAVATMGLACTREQVLWLSRFPVRAVCFDSEPLAQRQAIQLCNDLSCFPPGQTYHVEITSHDPGEATEAEVQELRRRFLE